jgi:LPS export ABC transporter protein LptC
MRLRKKQALRLAVAVLALFFILSLTIFDSGPSKPKTASVAPEKAPTAVNAAPADNTNNSPEQAGATELNQFHRLETKNGKRLWEVKGTLATFDDPKDKDNTNAKSASPKINITDALFTSFENDQPAYEIKAQQAGVKVGLTGIDEVSLKKNVRLQMQSKYVLESELADYNGTSQNIAIPVPVKISGEGFEITGNKLYGNLKEKKFTLLGKVNTFIAAKTTSKTQTKDDSQ